MRPSFLSKMTAAMMAPMSLFALLQLTAVGAFTSTMTPGAVGAASLPSWVGPSLVPNSGRGTSNVSWRFSSVAPSRMTGSQTSLCGKNDRSNDEGRRRKRDM